VPTSSNDSRYRNGAGGSNNYLLEQQNDEMVDGLSEKIGSLKNVAIAIGDDVREQNKMLNDMVRPHLHLYNSLTDKLGFYI
jgi:hypothetical protein